MLDIQNIKKFYDNSLHTFERGILREYLQYQILSIIFSHPLSNKLSFLGGTCLRIVHGLPRFSEDIDFDNKDLKQEDFKKISEFLEKELEKNGYIVEVKFVTKQAFHCYIKFPDLLYKSGISTQSSEKILIQIDTFNQGVNYNSDIFILDKFEFFNQIKVTPKAIILSQKLWTITQRPRLKGRDFFDIMFLAQNTNPDLEFLQAKFGKLELKDIIEKIILQLADADYSALSDDVRPFVINRSDADKIKLFPNFLKQKWG